MEIHKPRPWRGGPEFPKEYAIVGFGQRMPPKWQMG
jgi:hypothetical protein